tara:strand:+ start:169 stop:669 length:501 start_codon:yes stop_codon:yes gene_type:complete
MAYSTVPKTKRDGKIELLDGTGSPVVLEVAYEDGNFSFSQPQQFSELVIMDRGNFSTIRRQDEQTITGSFSFHFREFTSADVGSVRDFINKSGAYAANISTGDAGVPFVEHFCIDIRYTAEGTDFGDTGDHIVALGKCVCSLDFSEGDPSSFTLNFTCYGGVTQLS